MTIEQIRQYLRDQYADKIKDVKDPVSYETWLEMLLANRYKSMIQEEEDGKVKISRYNS